jgi:hypothetical protein
MSNPYSSFCEDFYVNMRLGSQLTLPTERDTVVHFFDRLQRAFPQMTRFRRHDNGELNLEEDRNEASYRWVTLEPRRLSSGHVNPENVAESLKLHRFVLEQAPHNLGITPVEIDYLDILLGFDLSFSGNHDEIVAESLLCGCPLLDLAEEAGARPVDVQPSITISLSEDCRLQGRIDVVTRTNSYQVRTGDYADDMISVYFTLRRYWGDRPKVALEEMIAELAERADTLCGEYVLPRIVRPLSAAIASRS